MPADGPLWALDGVAPKIAPDAWVAPSATVIGDVELGAGASIWWHCLVRGDTNHIRIGAGSNIQDGSILHVNSGNWPCLVGANVTVGHACIIHACTLEDRAFVGMGATVLDGAVIEEGGMLGACGLLPPGKRIGRNELWTGAPAKLRRVMSADERAEWDQTAVHYQALSKRYRIGLAPVASR